MICVSPILSKSNTYNSNSNLVIHIHHINSKPGCISVGELGGQYPTFSELGFDQFFLLYGLQYNRTIVDFIFLCFQCIR